MGTYPLSPTGEVVVRVVYDGPPRAGKTTSLRALADSFGCPLESPGEAEGRTLFFDWLEVVGGHFEGRSLRCQVIAVPGQRALEARRRAILDLADAVIVVADTTREGLDQLRPHLKGLRTVLDARGGWPVGTLVQANKRDLEQAVPVDELRRHIDGPDSALIETVATSGSGVRQAFLLAVRLALDRIRDQAEWTEGAAAGDDLRSPQDLLARLRQADQAEGSPEHAPNPDQGDLLHVMATELAAPAGPETPTGEPVAPSPETAGALLWPPVRGRLHLVWAWSAGDLEARRADDGSWRVEGALRWYAHSHPEDAYETLEQARAALGRWSQTHATGRRCLSPGRTLAVAPAGNEGWRLWQVVQRDPSLHDLVIDALDLGRPREVADRLWSVAQALIGARVELLRAGLPLPCTLETCGVANGRSVFSELLPSPGSASLLPEPEDRRTFLRRRFQGVAQAIAERPALSVGSILDRLEERSRRTPSRSWVSETLAALLIEA